MDHTALAYEELIGRFVEWAQTQPDIRGAIVLGSRARKNRPADEWADLDVVMVVDEPDKYVSCADWVKNMGSPILTFIESTATGQEKERRVLYEGGLDVDFALIPKEKAYKLFRTEMIPEATEQIYSNFGRGIRILLDKEGMLSKLEAVLSSLAPPSISPPTFHEYLEIVNDFLYHVVFTAKHLRRGELWWAKGTCDDYLKYLLRRMLEWHARLKGRDTWFRGRFLEEWADSRALVDLKKAFAHYDEEDTWHALFETLNLFRWLACETAEALNFQYPALAHEQTEKMTKRLFEGRNRTSRFI